MFYIQKKPTTKTKVYEVLAAIDEAGGSSESIDAVTVRWYCVNYDIQIEKNTKPETKENLECFAEYFRNITIACAHDIKFLPNSISQYRHVYKESNENRTRSKQKFEEIEKALLKGLSNEVEPLTNGFSL
ncbi:MAG: hypothetical protein H0T84_04460 [Tatlockia sp.]|nr:hypothetical protein [Tatlockia sp.]